MTKTILMATTAVLIAGPALAQAPAEPVRAPQAAQAPLPTGPTTEKPLVDTAQQGVLVFTPDFFADQRPVTALDMVARVPGFSITDGDGSRGFEGSVGNILINGARPASKNDTGSAVLSRTVVANVERIELIRGGAPGIDMQGFAVVVNVITKRESSRQSIVSVGATFFEGARDLYSGQWQFTAREGDTTWGFSLSDGVGMSDSTGSGPFIRTDAAGNVIRREQFENTAYGGGNSLRGNFATPLWGGKIDLTARYGVNDFHQDTLITAPGVLRENRFDDEGTGGEFGVVYTRPVREGLLSESRFIHTFGSGDSVSTNAATLGTTVSPEQRFESVGDSSETILRSLLRWERSSAITLEGGAEVAYNMLDTSQSFTVGGTSVPLPSASVKVEETRGEAFGKGTWRVRPNLTLEGGLRLEASTISQSGDADQEKSFYYAKPRLQATWTPMPQNQLRARFELEVGQLDFGQFAASADLVDDSVFGGNVNLEPEQRWISEITYERRFLDDGIVSIGFRHDEIENVIDRIPLSDGLSAIGNIGRGTLDQLAVNVVVPMGWAGFSGGRITARNTWNHTEVTDPTTGERRPISFVRPSQANIGIAQDITSWKTNWGLNWLPLLSQAGFDPDQRSSFRGRDYFEGFVEYKPTPTLSIRAQATVWDDFIDERIVYADRQSRAVAFIDRRFIDPRTFYRVTVRKTF